MLRYMQGPWRQSIGLSNYITLYYGSEIELMKTKKKFTQEKLGSD